MLTDFGVQIAPSTYYAARDRPPSPRAVRDGELKKEIVRVFKENYSVYGAKKIWWALNREGIRVGRCRVERLMRALGLTGALRGKTIRTTVSDPDAERATDLVRRQFAAGAPNRLWVADFTHVSTWAGTVYVAFAIDVFSRRIVGWSASMSKETNLVLDAIDMGYACDATGNRSTPPPIQASWCTILMPAASIRRSGSPSTSSTPGLTPRSARSAMPWTMRSPNQRSAYSRPS